MKAFSKVPDPFGEHLQTAGFRIPLQKVFQIEAISQSQYHDRNIHIISNPDQSKNQILSIDIEEQMKEQVGKDSQNTAITQINLTSKEISTKQKLNEAEKELQKQEEKTKSIFCDGDLSIDLKPEKIKQDSASKKVIINPQHRIQTSELQSQINLAIYSNIKSQISHIVFSHSEEQMTSLILHKKPIFPKDQNENSTEKKLLKEMSQQPESQIERQQIHKEIQKLDQFAIIDNSHVEDHIEIECSLFNNTVSKEGSQEMKKTEFDIGDSVAKIFNEKFSEPQSNKPQESRAQKPSVISWSQKVIRLNNMDGKRMRDSKMTNKRNLWLLKLSLTKSICIEPVFF